MKTLGNSGIEISAVGLGCMNFGMMCNQATTDSIVSAALDAGVNFFDVANTYGGPEGKAEAMLSKALGNQRQNIILATKFGATRAGAGGAADGGGSAEFITQAVESSLKLLNTDYIDLYQHHFPDTGTPIDETLRALEELVQQGKVRSIGCSNYSGAQLADAAGFSLGNGSTACFVPMNPRMCIRTAVSEMLRRSTIRSAIRSLQRGQHLWRWPQKRKHSRHAQAISGSKRWPACTATAASAWIETKSFIGITFFR